MPKKIEEAELKERMSDIINALNLTPEEEPLFEKFIDPVTLDYIDIPVCLREKYFNETDIP